MPTSIGSISTHLQKYTDAHHKYTTNNPTPADQTRIKPLFERAVSVVDPKRVGSKTINRLRTADTIGKAVGDMLSRGNQKYDVVESSGVSRKRVLALRSMHSNNVAKTLTAGVCAGNCSEFTQLETGILTALNRRGNFSDPVTALRKDLPEVDNDHVFLVLGDPRMESEDKVAVLDGWVNRPSAHTLDKNKLNDGTLQVASFAGGSFSASLQPDFLTKDFDRVTDKEVVRKIENRDTTQAIREEEFRAETGMGSNDDLSAEQVDIDSLAFNVDTYKSNPVVEYYTHPRSGVEVSFDYGLAAEVDLMDEIKTRVDNIPFGKHPNQR